MEHEPKFFASAMCSNYTVLQMKNSICSYAINLVTLDKVKDDYKSKITEKVNNE